MSGLGPPGMPSARFEAEALEDCAVLALAAAAVESSAWAALASDDEAKAMENAKMVRAHGLIGIMRSRHNSPRSTTARNRLWSDTIRLGDAEQLKSSAPAHE